MYISFLRPKVPTIHIECNFRSNIKFLKPSEFKGADCGGLYKVKNNGTLSTGVGRNKINQFVEKDSILSVF